MDLELELKRTAAVGDAIIGSLFTDDVFECFTLERVGFEIPCGRYEVVVDRSDRFSRLASRIAKQTVNVFLPHVLNVPYRYGIRIHALNYPAQSAGCIGVGQEHTVSSVEHSRLALQKLQPKISGAGVRGDRVWLTIKAPIDDSGLLKA